jgi:hypothetical protein
VELERVPESCLSLTSIVSLESHASTFDVSAQVQLNGSFGEGTTLSRGESNAEIVSVVEVEAQDISKQIQHWTPPCLKWCPPQSCH